MKRSEMIDVIKKVLLEEDGTPTNAHAEEVLDAIEKAGMAPPLTHVGSTKYAVYSQKEIDPENFEQIREWEDETDN
jgi:hypothetical protein